MGRFQAAALCRELGAELRKQRELAGLSESQLARKMGWWPAKISRMETGHINASDVDVVQYLAYCGCYLGEVQDIIDLCRIAEHEHGYWLKTFGKHQEDSVRSLIYHEATASASISYEPNVMPGLLQTEDYARETMRQYVSLAEEDLEFSVLARLERQQVLHRPAAAEFIFFIHEHALAPPAGDLAIMHEQLISLMLIGGLPHVTIRVVPESGRFGGAFRLFRFAKHDPLVYLTSHVAGLFLEDQEFVEPYRALVPVIASIALDEGQSRELFATLANEYDRGSAHTHVEEKQL